MIADSVRTQVVIIIASGYWVPRIIIYLLLFFFPPSSFFIQFQPRLLTCSGPQTQFQLDSIPTPPLTRRPGSLAVPRVAAHAARGGGGARAAGGETVVALGKVSAIRSPAVGRIRQHRGILSSKQRAVPKENEELKMENWLQTDALINPGNSGGPLVDLKGDLIGLNVAIYQGAQGIGFAIPVNEVREALADIFNPETASRWFGAHVSVTPPLVVKKVDPDSPAEEAGLKIGDDIMSINGHPAGDYIELNRTLRESQKMMVDLSVARDGELRNVQVRMLPFAEVFRQRLGVDLQELTGELVNQLGLQRFGGLESGLLVSRVEKGSPAEKASLQEYFLVNEIGGHPVRNFLDAFLALSDLKKSAQTEIAVLVPATRGNVIIGYQRGQTDLRLR